MKAVPIFLGVCTVLLTAACSNTPPRVTPPQPVNAGSPPADSQAAANVDRSQADVDNDMQKRGYKPAVYRGERVYCRNEPITGSNLESKVCRTARQIADQERLGKDILNKSRPAGCAPPQSCN